MSQYWQFLLEKIKLCTSRSLPTDCYSCTAEHLSSGVYNYCTVCAPPKLIWSLLCDLVILSCLYATESSSISLRRRMSQGDSWGLCQVPAALQQCPASPGSDTETSLTALHRGEVSVTTREVSHPSNTHLLGHNVAYMIEYNLFLKHNSYFLYA